MSRHLHAIGSGALMALVRAGLAQAPIVPAQPAAPTFVLKPTISCVCKINSLEFC
jgi:hypothetical protein